MTIVEIDWAESKEGIDMAGMYGPFADVEASYDWGVSVIRNGEWQVHELIELETL